MRGCDLSNRDPFQFYGGPRAAAPPARSTLSAGIQGFDKGGLKKVESVDKSGPDLSY